MKFLFIIHSHTTFLSSIGTINYLGIKHEDIRIAFIRNYKNTLYQFKSPTINLSWAFEYPIYSNFFKYKGFIKRIDNILRDFIGDENFIMCASFPGNILLYQIIFSNRNCVGFKYIQEGALPFDNVYRNKLPILYRLYGNFLRFWFKDRLWSSHGLWTVPTFLKGKLQYPTECYAIDEDFFKNLDCKLNLIKWPSIDMKKTKYGINPEYPCFVLESSVEMGVVEKEVYLGCVNEMILQKAEQNNYIKFHPYQSDDNKRLIVDMFKKKRCNVELLSMEVPFEFYLSSYQSLKVYGFKSSLLVFAQNLGHQTYSMEDELLKRSKTYRTFRYSR